MRIDSTNKVIQQLTDENPPEKSSQPAPLQQDVIESAASKQNTFTQLTGGEQAVSEGNSEWSDVAEKVVTGVAADVGLVVGAFTLGAAAPALPFAIGSPEGILGLPVGPDPLATALGVATVADFSDVSDAVADTAGAVADAVSDASGAVADAISDVCNW